MVNCIVAFLLGVILALAISIVITILGKRRSDGTLKVYIPDIPDEPPYFYVELEETIDIITKKNAVSFKVEVWPLCTDPRK